MIQTEDLTGVTEDVARALLLRARSIAPCLDSLSGELRKDAIAVLRNVAAELPAPGERRTKSLSRNGTSLQLDSAGSAFSADDIAALRALCPAASTAGHPRGSFPEPVGLNKIWPERYKQ